MAGMYPDNQNIEIFGEQVSWPGVNAAGKFTNGSFSNPLVKPSFIPAETMNLILDNLESIITKCGGTPNTLSKTQVADALLKMITNVTPNDYGLYSEGRDLRLVLGIESTNPAVYIPQIMGEIRRRCNNYNEINNTKIPSFEGIKIGDYIDGLNLGNIVTAPDGTAPSVWNSSYKNNRIIVGGLNWYKNSGDIENDKNSILFIFRDCLCKGIMKSVFSNADGYTSSDCVMREWLEGINGDGSGPFATGLKNALGGDYLYTIRKSHNIQGISSWNNYTVWPPSEIELYGHHICGDELGQKNSLHIQIPIYQISGIYRNKRMFGARVTYWESTTLEGSQNAFCLVNLDGTSGVALNNAGYSSSPMYVSPVFLVK